MEENVIQKRYSSPWREYLEFVKYEVKENIARITMNRADKINALNHGLWDDLIAAFDKAEWIVSKFYCE